jgi:hypothetical protein
MSDNSGQVDEILDDLELDGSSVEDTGADPSQSTETGLDNAGRLEKLRDAGVLTENEYEILRAHHNGEGGSITESPDFGQPIVTSEGRDFDFSIIGVFEDIDTSDLTLADVGGVLSDNEAFSGLQGGEGRTLIFWQIYNHSDSETKLKHKNIEHIGEDQIAYNYDGNPLQTDNLKPGWRTDNWVDISADTRIKYASSIEIPVPVSEVKLAGYWSDVHNIEITEEMKFPKSELPANVDL